MGRIGIALNICEQIVARFASLANRTSQHSLDLAMNDSLIGSDNQVIYDFYTYPNEVSAQPFLSKAFEEHLRRSWASLAYFTPHSACVIDGSSCGSLCVTPAPVATDLPCR